MGTDSARITRWVPRNIVESIRIAVLLKKVRSLTKPEKERVRASTFPRHSPDSGVRITNMNSLSPLISQRDLNYGAVTRETRGTLPGFFMRKTATVP